MIFVTFKIQTGEHDHFDYSWFDNYSIAHYEDAKSITDKDMIRDVYNDEDVEIFNELFNDATDTYEMSDGDWITVYKVQEMTEKELDVLSKLGVLHR